MPALRQTVCGDAPWALVIVSSSLGDSIVQLGSRSIACFDIRCPISLVRKMRLRVFNFLAQGCNEGESLIYWLFHHSTLLLYPCCNHGKVASYSRTSVFLSVKRDSSGPPETFFPRENIGLW